MGLSLKTFGCVFLLKKVLFQARNFLISLAPIMGFCIFAHYF